MFKEMELGGGEVRFCVIGCAIPNLYGPRIGQGGMPSNHAMAPLERHWIGWIEIEAPARMYTFLACTEPHSQAHPTL